MKYFINLLFIIFSVNVFGQKDTLVVNSIEEATNISLNKVRELYKEYSNDIIVSYEYKHHKENLKLNENESIENYDCNVFHLKKGDYLFLYKILIKVSENIHLSTVLYMCEKDSKKLQSISPIYSDETTYIINSSW